MKLTTNSPAPAFRTEDVYGAPFDLQTLARSGQKILLTFFRNAGCPVCNTRVSQLMGNVQRWQEMGLTVVAVYESSKENLLGFVLDKNERKRFPFKIIADPSGRFYEAYKVEISLGKMLNGMTKIPVLSMLKNGIAFNESLKKPKDDGPFARISADFLIDERGIIRTAHYGSFGGDYLSVEAITAFANSTINTVGEVG